MAARDGSGTVTNEPLNYTGQRRDSTGLLFYNARYYDPVLGRFLSPDTIVPGAASLSITLDHTTGSGPADPQDLNRYSYVNNNPINKTDPTGHCGVSGFVNTAISVMSGDCTRRSAEAFRRARTTEQKIVTGAVAGLSVVGAVAGWAGSALLAVAGGQFVAGVLSGSGAAASATGAAGAAATAASADGDPTNEVITISRALTQADLGIRGHLDELKGSFSVADRMATVRIDMIEGEIANPLQILRNLSESARAMGATKLRIEAYLANPTLEDILVRRYGMQRGVGPNGMDIIEINLKK